MLLRAIVCIQDRKALLEMDIGFFRVLHTMESIEPRVYVLKVSLY